jgi:DNA (cytosine-5)-methyltransferase 1
MTTPLFALHTPAGEAPPEEVGTSVELFTGGGGLAEGMRAAGYRHVLLNEYDHRACETLRMNRAVDYEGDRPGSTSIADAWPLIEGDVRKVDFSLLKGTIDVVAGGVPCQPWSMGGVHRGYEDPRNLWPEFVRAVRETHPRALLAENVRGLLRPSFSAYWRYTVRCLRAPHLTKYEHEEWRDHDMRLAKELRARSYDPAERYVICAYPVNAADYGVPQVRHRVFTIGVREDLGVDLTWPGATYSEGALIRAQIEGTYWARHDLRPRECVRRTLPGEDDGRLPWLTLRDAITGLPEPVGHRVEAPGWLHHYGWDGARVYPGHTPNLLDLPAKTVKAGVHGVPGGETVVRRDDGTVRYMTVREVARVMTFPDRWRLAGPRGEQMRQLGNAVPVLLGHVAARTVAAAIRPHPVRVR